jgi:hypothetical protein
LELRIGSLVQLTRPIYLLSCQIHRRRRLELLYLAMFTWRFWHGVQTGKRCSDDRRCRSRIQYGRQPGSNHISLTFGNDYSHSLSSLKWVGNSNFWRSHCDTDLEDHSLGVKGCCIFYCSCWINTGCTNLGLQQCYNSPINDLLRHHNCDSQARRRPRIYICTVKLRFAFSESFQPCDAHN